MGLADDFDAATFEDGAAVRVGACEEDFADVEGDGVVVGDLLPGVDEVGEGLGGGAFPEVGGVGEGAVLKDDFGEGVWGEDFSGEEG